MVADPAQAQGSGGALPPARGDRGSKSNAQCAVKNMAVKKAAKHFVTGINLQTLFANSNAPAVVTAGRLGATGRRSDLCHKAGSGNGTVTGNILHAEVLPRRAGSSGLRIGAHRLGILAEIHILIRIFQPVLEAIVKAAAIFADAVPELASGDLINFQTQVGVSATTASTPVGDERVSTVLIGYAVGHPTADLTDLRAAAIFHSDPAILHRFTVAGRTGTATKGAGLSLLSVLAGG